MARPATYHDEKKALLVQAAIDVFAEFGYDGATNRLIAERAGPRLSGDGQPVSTALLYHYFPKGKAQLFAACLDALAPLHSFDQILVQHQHASLATVLLALARAYNESLTEHNVMTIIRLKVIEGYRHAALQNAAVADLGLPGVREVLAYLAQQQEQGTLTVARSPDHLLLLLLSPIAMRRMTIALLAHHSPAPSRQEDETFLFNLVADLLTGIAGTR